MRFRSISLDGIFGTLTNVGQAQGLWLSHELDATRIRVRAAGQHLTVNGVDKFPRMTDYVVPSGRIADASRVRLGAHLAEGTTVMHEGFCNFNAGTLERQWSKAEFPPASSLATEAMLAVARRLWARCRAVAPLKSPLVSAVYSVRTQASVSASVMTALLRQACTSLSTPVLTPDGNVVKAIELSGRSGSCLFVMVDGQVVVRSAPGRGAH